MPDFSTRSNSQEIMDDLTCSGEVVHQTLKELDFINKWLGGDRVTLHAVEQLLKEVPKHQEIVVADLGCGSGKMLSLISAVAKKRNQKVRLIGIDANPNIILYAKTHAIHSPNTAFQTLDIFSKTFADMHFDIIIGTLFFHHFTEEQLTRLFKQLKSQARIGIIVNDIHRHPISYYSIKWLTALFSKSAMVKYDAPLSVLRSFTKKEWKTMLSEHTFKYSLGWKWAFRWSIIIYSKR